MARPSKFGGARRELVAEHFAVAEFVRIPDNTRATPAWPVGRDLHNDSYPGLATAGLSGGGMIIH